MARAKPTHAAFTFYVKPMHKIPHPFPIDMLRRDHCVPATEQDAHRIENLMWAKRESVDDPPESERIVALTRFYPVGSNPAPTLGRWESFGWTMLGPYEAQKHTGSAPENIMGYPHEVLTR